MTFRDIVLRIPFGKITITLNDVSCLLYLFIRGDFQDPVEVISEKGVIYYDVEFLGVELEKTRK